MRAMSVGCSTFATARNSFPSYADLTPLVSIPCVPSGLIVTASNIFAVAILPSRNHIVGHDRYLLGFDPATMNHRNGLLKSLGSARTSLASPKLSKNQPVPLNPQPTHVPLLVMLNNPGYIAVRIRQTAVRLFLELVMTVPRFFFSTRVKE